MSPNLKNPLASGGSLEVAPRSRWDVSRVFPELKSERMRSRLSFFQTFQRIQRNRQSRIRVKLSRRAGKRYDEILEEDAVTNIHPFTPPHDPQANKMEQPQSSSTPGNYHSLFDTHFASIISQKERRMKFA